MGSADLPHAPASSLQPGKGIPQGGQAGQQAVLQTIHRRHMQRRGEDVVAALGAIDMVVGVECHAALGCDMGDDLIDVHIGLGAAAGLPDMQRKLRRILPS